MTTTYWYDCQGQCIDGKYYLQQFLGHGNFGGVFLAHHVAADSLLREVAIKLIVPRPDMFDRQIGELRGATTLHHPNLLACYDAGECVVNGTRYLYLVMERAEETLQQRLSRGPLAQGEAREITRSIAEALRYLHDPARCHVHRDVKPDNILRVGNVWKVSDLGLLREVNDGTVDHTGMIAGTYAYMPPESFEGEVSPAWDIWSLGVLLVASLTGRLPFEGRNQNDMIRRIQRDTPHYPRLSPPFDGIVQGCLQKSRRQRLTAQQVLQALDGAPIQSTSWHTAALIAVAGLAALLLLPKGLCPWVGAMLLVIGLLIWSRVQQASPARHWTLGTSAGMGVLLMLFGFWPRNTSNSLPPKQPEVRVTVPNGPSPKPAATVRTVPAEIPGVAPAPHEKAPIKRSLKRRKRTRQPGASQFQGVPGADHAVAEPSGGKTASSPFGGVPGTEGGR